MLIVWIFFLIVFFVIFNCLVFFVCKPGAQTQWGPKPSGGPNPVGGPKGGGPNPEKVGARRVGARRVGSPKFRAFFPSPATKFVLFFPLWGSSRGILVVFEVPGRSNVHVWSSLVVKPPGVHTTTREPKRAHLRVPAFKNTTKIQREDTQRGKKRVNFWAVQEKGGPGEGRSRGKLVQGKGGPNQTLKPTPTHETPL